MAAERIPFTKMQGAGNDYVVINGFAHPIADPAALARVSCDRRRGVGADGLLLALPSEAADVCMRMFNPDGSEAEMCGNGLRCLARYVAARGLVADPLRMRIETGAGILGVVIDEGAAPGLQISADMGQPRLERADVPMVGPAGLVLDEEIEAGGERHRITAVSMGNPHCVLFVEDVASAPVHVLGPVLETHALFPSRTNVEFVQVVDATELHQRTWERGVGETEACGTGACAVAVAAALTGRAGRDVTIHLRGGDLRVRWDAEDHVHLTGPAVEVFEGWWALDRPGT